MNDPQEWQGDHGDQCHDCGEWTEVNEETICESCYDAGGYGDADENQSDDII